MDYGQTTPTSLSYWNVKGFASIFVGIGSLQEALQKDGLDWLEPQKDDPKPV